MVEPAGGLIEQEQRRLGDERTGELDPFERPEGEPARKPVAEVAEVEVVEHLQRLFSAAPLREGAQLRVRADEQVFEDRHVLEEHDVLEGARDSEAHDPVRGRSSQVLAVEDDATAVRLIQPRDEIEERRLPSAVGPDQPDDLPLLQRKRDIGEGHDPAETPRDILDRQKRHRRRDDMTVRTANAFRR